MEVLVKTCSKCKIEKPLEQFDFNKSIGYFQSWCKICTSQYRSEYRQKHKEEITIKKAKYYKENKDKIKIKRLADYHKDPKKFIKRQYLYKKKRLKEDPIFRLIENLRRRSHAFFKNLNKSAPTMELIGCSVDDLKKHLEFKFYANPKTGEIMTWDNHGRLGWHIDHIRPIKLFDLSDAEQQRKCFHYTNLQPLWWFDNLEKGSKGI